VKVAIYVRVSSEDQAQHGYSLDAQRAACRRRAVELGADEIVECADEGVSGALLDRPGLNHLRALVKARAVTAVVMYDPDRFARRLSYQLLVTEEIEKAGVRLDFINFEWQNTPEGKLFYSMRGAFSEYEREKIRLRTMTGRNQKARTGRLPFKMEPYGYRYDKARAQLTIYEPEATVVRRIFHDLAGRKMGLNGLAHALSNEGVPTRTGRTLWHRQVVRQIARNSVYRGVYYANRRNMSGMAHNSFKPQDERTKVTIREEAEWIPVEVPAIVDDATWQAAQAAMDRRFDTWRATRRSPYLLSGLLRCGRCGQTMTGRRSTSWGRSVQQYVCRKNTAGARHPGCNHQVSSTALDGAVWERVLHWLNHPEELASYMAEEGSDDRLAKEIAAAAAALEQIRRKRQALLLVLEKELAPQEEVMGKLEALRERDRVLRTHHDQLQAAAAHTHDLIPTPEEVRQWAEETLARIRDDMPVAERQAIVRAFVRRIVVSDETLTVHRVPIPMKGASSADDITVPEFVELA
jgi:site-specific DNA recombinase